MLDMFDPTTAPIAMLSLLFKTEEIPTKISGAEVPNATMVNPIVNSLTQSSLQLKMSYLQICLHPKLIWLKKQPNQES